MPTYREQVLADGAVAYWRLDESSGNALSQVGNYPGTVTGGVTRGQPGPLSDGNAAMQFDGTDGAKVTSSLTDAMHGASVLSWELWVKLNSLAAPNGLRMASQLGAVTAANYFGYSTSSGGHFLCSLTINGVQTTVIALGVDLLWHHLVATYDGINLRLYRDGVLVNTTAGSGTISNAGAFVVGNWSVAGYGWLGLIDEVAIYSKALTPQQIAEHYALRYGQRTYQEFVIADGAVAYWKLDESSGTVAKSQVGSYDGTISGGVTLGQPGAINGYTAMAFDGSTGKIAGSSISVPATFTVELWFRTSQTATKAMFSNRNPLTGNEGLYFGLTTGLIFAFCDGLPFTGIRQVADGQWHHAVFALGAGTGILYLDGTLETQAAKTALARAFAWNIAFDTPNAGDFFSGQLDEVAIYPTALTPQQIAVHYQARIAWPDTPYAPSVPADVYPAGSLSNRWLPLTPSDVIDAPFGKLWIGGAGTLAAVGADGRIVNFTGVRAGTMLPLAGRRINATNTTATAILALRTQ